MELERNLKAQSENKPLSLDDYLIVPFLKAMQTSDHKSLGLNQSDFETLIVLYLEKAKDKDNNFEARISKIKDKKFIVLSTLYVLSKEPADEEMMEVLSDQGYNIKRDTYFQDLNSVLKDLKIMEFKISNLEAQAPKKAKKKVKPGEEDNNIFAILTGISTGLELTLNFNTMCISEFLAWKEQLERKIDHIKKTSPKNKK